MWEKINRGPRPGGNLNGEKKSYITLSRRGEEGGELGGCSMKNKNAYDRERNDIKKGRRPERDNLENGEQTFWERKGDVPGFLDIISILSRRLSGRKNRQTLLIRC